HVSAGTTDATVVSGACCQIRRASRANLYEVTAGRICTGGRKLRAVGFQKCTIARPILSSPDTQGTLEDRSASDRIGNNGSVKLRTFAAGHNWPTGDHPLQWIAAPKVHVVKVSTERVES